MNYFPKTNQVGSMVEIDFSITSSDQAKGAYSMADRLVEACEARSILYSNHIRAGELVMVLLATPRSRKLLLEMADDW